MLDHLTVGSKDLQHVPVERTVRSCAHVGHDIHDLDAEFSDRRDELKRCPRELAGDCSERNQFVA
jgi:hypothetical protein